MKKVFKLSITATLLSLSISSHAIDVATATIRDVKIALSTGKTTSERLVTAYLERINRFDHKGPNINAIVELNDDAIEQAKAWDKSGDKTLSLGGVPFLIKDNFNVKGVANAGGSVALLDNIAKYNATLVQLLLDNGAILLGRTNMSELAASFGKFGYSSRGGQTLNPMNLERDPSGSSSGSAAAVSSGFSTFAIGTDTSGSVRGPAAVVGLVGFRPSIGMVSRHGIIPLALTADIAGPITRTAEDLALVMDVIAKPDPFDRSTSYYYSDHKPPEFINALAKTNLKGKRFGFISNFNGGHKDVDNIMSASVNKMKENGAEVIDIRLPSIFEDLNAKVLKPIFTGEFKPQFENHLASNQTHKQLIDVVNILSSSTWQTSTTPVNPGRLAGLRANLLTQETDSAEYIMVQNQLIPRLRNEVNQIMNKNSLDGFLFATRSCPAAPLPEIIDTNFKCDAKDMMAGGYIASVLGYPEITIPAGLAQNNMPIGLSIMGRYGSDEQIVGIGNAFEEIAFFSAENIFAKY